MDKKEKDAKDKENEIANKKSSSVDHSRRKGIIECDTSTSPPPKKDTTSKG